MSDFDNLIKPDDFDEVERLLAQERATKRSAPAGKKEKQKTLMEMLAGSNDAGQLARKLNVDPDMSEKVIVPLLNFLDKYGVGGAVSESPTAQAATGLIEFLTDITPVVRESMDYFAGRQKELSQQDMDFLNQIKEAQTSDMDGLFIGENLEPEPEPEPQPEPKQQEGQIPADVNPFRDGVDWTAVVGEQKKPTVIPEAEPSEAYIQGLERLAMESGMTMDQIQRSDRQNKTNHNGRFEKEIDYSDAFTIDLGLEKINAAMDGEKKRLASQSKVEFDENVPVPDSANQYDPLGEPNYTIPSFTGTLETVDDLADSAGVDLSDTPWNEESYDPVEDEIQIEAEDDADDSAE
jgi:hypothetical protein|tara:strand:- start:1183 stop:2232 length:1050 start_codon:yes stop_codon:yes gene_type:complete